MESHRFNADVRQILDLVTHSLYSDREIFLRELVSNASDALDRARFESLSNEDLRSIDGEPGIRIWVDTEAHTITIEDDGIGLTADEAREHLGTIAHSGTRAFAEALKEKGEGGGGLVGQFGVGFYSSFMVADKVVVETLSARPDSEAVRWSCDGGEDYALEPGSREARGTAVTLHLREDAQQFGEIDEIKQVVRRHSDFVSWPILIEDERANQEAALWTRNPSEVEDDDYQAFYRHVSGDWQDALTWVHFRAEGTLEYQAVLFVPQKRPYELDRLDYKVGLKLFQKRVKILDNADQLLPRYLRWIRGVVDSPDVQLNVSREILQQTPVLASIKKQLTKKVLKQLKTLSKKDPAKYGDFWTEFGHILKEGFHEDADQKGLLTDLLRFRTTTSDGELRSLAEIKADLKEGQDTIWFLADLDKAPHGVQRLGVRVPSHGGFSAWTGVGPFRPATDHHISIGTHPKPGHTAQFVAGAVPALRPPDAAAGDVHPPGACGRGGGPGDAAFHTFGAHCIGRIDPGRRAVALSGRSCTRQAAIGP